MIRGRVEGQCEVQAVIVVDRHNMNKPKRGMRLVFLMQRELEIDISDDDMLALLQLVDGCTRQLAS